MLDSVSSFLSEHQREVVLLDFNHFFNMEEEHHAMLISLLSSHFGDLLLPVSKVQEVTLSDMWNQGKQVSQYTLFHLFSNLFLFFFLSWY